MPAIQKINSIHMLKKPIKVSKVLGYVIIYAGSLILMSKIFIAIL